MRIAFIGQKGIPSLSGGVEKHVEKLATRLAASGQEVFVYVRSHYTDPSLTEYAGVKLIHIPSIRTKHLEAISHALFATAHMLFQNYDVVHYHSIGPSVFTILPRIFRPGIRVVATFHTRDYFHKKWGWFARLCLRIAEYLTCVVPEKTIVISETLLAYAKKTYKKNFSFIPNGAEVEYEPDAALLNQWGIRPKRYILSVSRLVEHKGIHYLIKAFRELERQNKVPNNFKLVIVGTHAYTQEYEKYLRVLSEGARNIVFTGELHGKDLAVFFSHASLFVQPSEEEGLSLALLEAMAYGLLPIVSDIPANMEAIRNGSGISFTVKDVESLKKELAYYINRPEEAAVIGAIAKERAEQEYSWDAIAQKTLEVYEDALRQYSNVKEHYASYRTK
ncbi:MAG: glycosyltransferase family 4 protein [Candidatus Moraniibacteriota bacterium]